MIATRRNPGTMSRKISSRLLLSSAAINVTPVILPRGRDKLLARPAAGGSPLIRREARLPLSRQPPNLDSPRIVLGLGSRGQNYAEGGKSQKGASVHLSSLRSAIIELGRATTKYATAHTLQPVDWL